MHAEQVGILITIGGGPNAHFSIIVKAECGVIKSVTVVAAQRVVGCGNRHALQPRRVVDAVKAELANDPAFSLIIPQDQGITIVGGSKGAMKGIVGLGAEPNDEARAQLEASPSMEGRDLASSATCPEESVVGDSGAKYQVVAFDFGMKQNIVRIFASKGCRVTVVPAKTSPERVRELEPDGVFLSNGPGDPVNLA